jgi:hypothetical protein
MAAAMMEHVADEARQVLLERLGRAQLHRDAVSGWQFLPPSQLPSHQSSPSPSPSSLRPSLPSSLYLFPC